MQHEGAEDHVRRGHVRILPRLVDCGDVGDSGVRRAFLQQFNRIGGWIDHGDALGPRGQRQREPARAASHVEDVFARTQHREQAVEGRVVGAVGVHGPVGVSKAAGTALFVAVLLSPLAQSGHCPVENLDLLTPRIVNWVQCEAPVIVVILSTSILQESASIVNSYRLVKP